MLSWFRRHYDEFKDDNYAYYNVKKILTETDIDKIRNFCNKRSEIIFFIIISGVNELRPQRTYGGMPEWFRNNTSAHDLYKSENSFVFIGCFDKEWCGWDRFEEEKKNFRRIKFLFYREEKYGNHSICSIIRNDGLYCIRCFCSCNRFYKTRQSSQRKLFRIN